jgi:hypothetical protein
LILYLVSKLLSTLYKGLYKSRIDIKLLIHSVNVKGISAIIYEVIFIGSINQFVIKNEIEYIIDAKTPYEAKNRGFFAFLKNI